MRMHAMDAYCTVIQPNTEQTRMPNAAHEDIPKWNRTLYHHVKKSLSSINHSHSDSEPTATSSALLSDSSFCSTRTTCSAVSWVACDGSWPPSASSSSSSRPISPASSQPRLISTALVHCLYINALSWADRYGLKTLLLARFMCRSSSYVDQMPLANPAAMAAPRAVVSCIDGRSTGIWMISACDWRSTRQSVVLVLKRSLHTCMQISELLIPPSTARSVNWWPLSLAIASKMALVWKQAASRVARAIWPRCVCCVIPTTKFSQDHWPSIRENTHI